MPLTVVGCLRQAPDLDLGGGSGDVLLSMAKHICNRSNANTMINTIRTLKTLGLAADFHYLHVASFDYCFGDLI